MTEDPLAQSWVRRIDHRVLLSYWLGGGAVLAAFMIWTVHDVNPSEPLRVVAVVVICGILSLTVSSAASVACAASARWGEHAERPALWLTTALGAAGCLFSVAFLGHGLQGSLLTASDFMQFLARGGPPIATLLACCSLAGSVSADLTRRSGPQLRRLGATPALLHLAVPLLSPAATSEPMFALLSAILVLAALHIFFDIHPPNLPNVAGGLLVAAVVWPRLLTSVLPLLIPTPRTLREGPFLSTWLLCLVGVAIGTTVDHYRQRAKQATTSH